MNLETADGPLFILLVLVIGAVIGAILAVYVVMVMP